MSKRQVIRARQQRQRVRNRIITILLVVLGALLVAFALVIPSINALQEAASATQTAQVIVITPQVDNLPVNGPHLGDPNALVKVDIYEDFRCSACKTYTDTVEPQIRQDYAETGKVYYTYHAYIVIDSYDQTTASRRAANAALCAADQGQFWPYHDTLFANQITEEAWRFSDDRLIAMAQNLGLDMTAFEQCFQANQHDGEIQNDITQGDSLGINSTPSVFVNGKKVPYTDAIAAIDAALAGQ